MTADRNTAFEAFLDSHTTAAWTSALDTLNSEIHEVDRNATRVWFHFYPLDLHLALTNHPDPTKLARQLLLEGEYKLATQIDSSAHFLYGHRYWSNVKQAVSEYASTYANDTRQLTDVVREISRSVARQVKGDASLLAGITFVALMTLRQTNLAAFSVAVDEAKIKQAHSNKSPDEIARERLRDDSQGLFGFLRTEDKKWSIVYDETRSDRRFKCFNGEVIASGAARDNHEDWYALDSRRSEGPIPVQCRAASCGACWVGVLGGERKLSPVNERLEGMNIKQFGYINTTDAHPVIRLACMAQTHGAAAIVIPPWNGFFGKYLQTGSTAEFTSEQVIEQLSANDAPTAEANA